MGFLKDIFGDLIETEEDRAKAAKFMQDFCSHPWYLKIRDFIVSKGMEIEFVPRLKSGSFFTSTVARLVRDPKTKKFKVLCSIREMAGRKFGSVMLDIAHEIGHKELGHADFYTCAANKMRAERGKEQFYCPKRELSAWLMGIFVLKNAGFSVVISSEAIDKVPELVSLFPAPDFRFEKGYTIYLGRWMLKEFAESMFLKTTCSRFMECIGSEEYGKNSPDMQRAILALRKWGKDNKI